MLHRARPLGIVIGIAFGLCLMAVEPGKAAPRKGPPLGVEVSSLEELRQAVEKATPGSVIRLAPGTYQIFADDLICRSRGFKGCPISRS